jgi:hypothetical protein
MQHVDRKKETRLHPKNLNRQDYQRALAELEDEVAHCDHDLEITDYGMLLYDAYEDEFPGG